MTDQDRDQNRLDFFRNLGRYTVLGVMAAGGALLAKRHRINRNEHRCVNKSVCCGCAVYKNCGLPAAVSAKQQAKS